MLRFLVNLFSGFVFSAVLAASLAAQAPVPPPPPAVPNLEKPAYPDSTSGLEHLVKDIFKAQANNDGPRAEALLKSLVLPDARGWYEHVFGIDVANRIGDHYEKAASSIPLSLARLFLDAKHQGFSHVKAVRYQQGCSDGNGDGDDASGVLFLRRAPVPLYDLHLLNGDKFFRIFPLAYVDGGFRLILRPDAKLPPKEPDKHEDASSGLATPPRAAMGNAVQAAKLLKRVQPIYPEVASREGLSGTVKLHVIIDKEGKVAHLTVTKGACSLAESALAAVKQWRYAPTLLNGEPVEVETDVDVIFVLSHP